MIVYSNLAISLDGKIGYLQEPSKTIGSNIDKKIMNEIRKKADAIIVGSKTLHANPVVMKAKGVTKKCPINIVVTKTGKLNPKFKFWENNEVVRIVATGKTGIKNAIISSKDRALVKSFGAKKVDFKLLFKYLKSIGVKNLLVEGGGNIMGQVLQSNLLNEIYVTICPKIIGGTNNPLFVSSFSTFLPAKKLKIIDLKTEKSEIFAHYKVMGSLKI